MTTQTTTSPSKAIQSRGELASAFPNTDWAAAFSWLPRFNAMGGWIDENSIGRQILGQTPAQQIAAVAVQDEGKHVEPCPARDDREQDEEQQVIPGKA